jgi:signal transduction histidine kinase
MTLLNAAISHFDRLQQRLGLSPTARRVGWIPLLLLAGWIDYLMPPEVASAPLYILILIPIAFMEPLGVCLAYSLLAAGLYFTADVLSTPATITQVYPYWRALARFISFVLISSAISKLVGERRQLRLSEQALQEKARELEEKNRALEQSLRELKKLQEQLLARERQAAIAETVHAATYEIERPLVSISVFAEELLRLVKPHEEIHPLLEKIVERVRDTERILQSIREVRRGE